MCDAHLKVPALPNAHNVTQHRLNDLHRHMRLIQALSRTWLVTGQQSITVGDSQRPQACTKVSNSNAECEPYTTGAWRRPARGDEVQGEALTVSSSGDEKRCYRC